MENKILFITGRLPYPLDDGWKIRTFNLIKALASSGHCVDLITFVSECDIPFIDGRLEGLCRYVYPVRRKKSYSPRDLVSGLLGAVPFSVLNYREEEMFRQVAEVTAKNGYDFVQIEDVVMAQYATACGTGCKILDMHNCESDLLRRYAGAEKNLLKKVYASVTADKLANYERECLNSFDRILVCSDDDAVRAGGGGQHPRIAVIPNGVDTDYFSPYSTPVPDGLIFVGTMDYHANITAVVHFVDNLLPSLMDSYPDLTFTIVGKNPPPEIKRLASGHIIVTGAVTDVRPYLEKAAVVVVPLLVGGGTRLKILEAMSMGKAIVSTTIGAEGINAAHGEALLLADSDGDFVAAVGRLLENPAMAASLGANGRKFVEANYSWNVIAPALNQVYAALADEKEVC